jgi:hypothetical protein
MTHLLDLRSQKAHICAENPPRALKPVTVERLFMAALAVISAVWFAALGWCAYQLVLLAFF